MMKIYKYPLEIKDTVTVKMPRCAKVLTVQVQRGVPCIWAAVDPLQPYLDRRVFRIVGTGQSFMRESVNRYVGTFQMFGGDLVYHVFEIT
jgi:hypothetical protein